MKSFKTLTGAAFMDMKPQEIGALSRDELVHLTFRIRAIMEAIAAYIKSTETEKRNTSSSPATFDIQSEAEVLNLTAEFIAALSKDELEQLALRNQDVLDRCPIKPGCRFCSLPDEYVLHVLLEWLTIEDQARFDMALLNQMDRKMHLHLLRDTEHKGIQSVSEKEWGYSFNSGVAEWLESRNVFMRALTFSDNKRDIPAGLLARTGRQLLQINLSMCSSLTDTGLAEFVGSCPKLGGVCVSFCEEVTDESVTSLAAHFPRIHTLDVSYTQVTDAGLVQFGKGCRELKLLNLRGLTISDAGLHELAKGCLGLEQLNVCECHEITDEGVRSLAQFCPALSTLELAYTDVGDAGLARLGEGCRALTRLFLRALDISDVGMCKVAEGCPMLEEVHLGACNLIGDDTVSSLAKNCPGLTMLDLSLTRVKDAGLVRLAVGCGALKKLVLCYLGISDAGLDKLAQGCPRIVDVDLRECGLITEEGATSLATHCTMLRTLRLNGVDMSLEGTERLRAAYPGLGV